MMQSVQARSGQIERIDMLARQARSGSVAAFIATGILGVMIVPAVGWLPYVVWALCMVLSYRFRDIVVAGVLRRGRATERDEMKVAMTSAALALVVAAPGPLFMPSMGPDLRGLYTAVQVGWSAIAALVIGIHARSYLLYVVVSYSLLIAGWWQIVPLEETSVVAVMLLVAGFVLVRFAQRLSNVFNESVQMRHENRALVDRLTRSLEETAQAHLARARFLAAASHDMLQPVHALMLLVGVLRQSSSEHSREQAAHRIELTTAAIASMFRGLLDQARLDAGAVTPRKEPVDLSIVCRGIEAAYEVHCEERQLTLSVDCAADTIVLADAALMDRALRNLVDNAVKFTEHGSVAIRATVNDGRVCVVISDTGIGIPDADRPRVFEAFFRGATASGLGIEGVGLGLSVTAQLVALMDGEIELISHPGSGTQVMVYLPAAQPTASAPTDFVASHGAFGYEHVLVVEDDAGAREALLLWLTDHGCAARGAGSLQEALDLCRQTSFEPDLVLSDLHLANGPNGLRTIEALRAVYPRARTALVTGEAIEAVDVPADVGLLRKPVQPAQLVALLQGRQLGRVQA